MSANEKNGILLSYKSKKYRVIAQNILYRRYVKTETACFSNCAEKLHPVGGELPLLFALVPWAAL